ncbi:lipopolysaccharide biosynthesis protein [Agilicoccus flavus]|uniref:lipopolysaccharide biosynthesis protein n=1 Tax=Agilicoccus flavus TaxID=2775968 RepID=UPI001CF65B35|nr:oligosaccharide flippase family protein [Agilicoccus flavus]
MSHDAPRAGRPWLLDLEAPPSASLASRGVTSFVGLAAQGLIRLAVGVAVGRLAGSAALGVVAAGLATAQFLILLGPTTSGQAASRFIARARGRDDAGEVHSAAAHLARRVAGATLGLAVVAFVVVVARGQGASGAACVAALLVGLAGQQFTRGVHYGVGAVGRVVLLDVVLSSLGFIGLVAALQAGVRGLTLLLPLAVAYLVLTLLCWPFAARTDVSVDDRRALRGEIDRFVVLGSLGTLASAGLVQLSILVTARLGATAAGEYAAASNLAMPLTLVSGALALVLYPAMSEAVGHGDDATVAAQLDRGVRGILLLVTPVAAGLALLSDVVVGLVYGAGFTRAAAGGGAAGDVLAVLVLAVLAAMVAVPCVNALTSADERGIAEMAAASGVGLLVAGAGWVLALGRGDVRVVAYAYAAGVITTAAYAIARAARRWHPRWMRPLLGAAAMAAAVPLVRQSSDEPVARALAAVALAAAWAALLAPECRLVLSLLRRRGR